MGAGGEEAISSSLVGTLCSESVQDEVAVWASFGLLLGCTGEEEQVTARAVCL